MKEEKNLFNKDISYNSTSSSPFNQEIFPDFKYNFILTSINNKDNNSKNNENKNEMNNSQNINFHITNNNSKRENIKYINDIYSQSIKKNILLIIIQ